jgi:hypothetical protein
MYMYLYKYMYINIKIYMIMDMEMDLDMDMDMNMDRDVNMNIKYIFNIFVFVNSYILILYFAVSINGYILGISDVDKLNRDITISMYFRLVFSTESKYFVLFIS